MCGAALLWFQGFFDFSYSGKSDDDQSKTVGSTTENTQDLSGDADRSGWFPTIFKVGLAIGAVFGVKYGVTELRSRNSNADAATSSKRKSEKQHGTKRESKSGFPWGWVIFIVLLLAMLGGLIYLQYFSDEEEEDGEDPEDPGRR